MSIEDPNTITGQNALCTGAGKILGKIPFGGEIVNYICSRSDAYNNYVRLRPLMMTELSQSRPDQDQVLYFAAKLTETADFGAKRSNFRWYYIDGKRSGPIEEVDPVRVRKLPEDPDDIMYGFW